MTMALDEQIKTYDLYLSMRLAPMTLQSCYHLNHDMNNLEWRFVFPTYKAIAHDAKPSNFAQYLTLNKNVQIIDINKDSLQPSRCKEWMCGDSCLNKARSNR